MQENEQDVNKNNEKKIQEWESLDVKNNIRNYWETDYDECEKRHKEDKDRKRKDSP